jgi:hypothetical protein
MQSQDLTYCTADFPISGIQRCIRCRRKLVDYRDTCVLGGDEGPKVHNFFPPRSHVTVYGSGLNVTGRLPDSFPCLTSVN